MAISFHSIGEQCVTFYADNTAVKGAPCKLSDNDTVGACNSGDSFFGVITDVKNGLATVVFSGFVELPYSGIPLVVGNIALAADGNGGICADEDADSRLVVSVDSVNKTAVIKL